MRSQTTTLARSAFRSLSRTSRPSSNASSTPYICSTCRAASQPTSTLSPPLGRRTISTTTSLLHPSATTTSSSSSPQTSTAPSTPANAPQPRTHYTLFPQTFPAGPPPDSPFLPNLRALRAEFLSLQAQTHPDRFSGSEKPAAEARSAALNDAYRTLADPLRHANYLLAQRGVDTEDESAKLEDPELLMEVMEAREKVDEVEEEEGLGPLLEENRMRVEGSVHALVGLIGEKRWEEAGREAVKLRYWRNVEESIRGWEKGVGGGAVHH